MMQHNAEKMKFAQVLHKIEPTTDDNKFAFMTGDYAIVDNQLTFLLDSGASDHLINDDSLFTSYVDLQPPVKILVAKNNTYVIATKRGEINMISNMGIRGVFKDVLYCPDVPQNLLSVRRMQKAGMSITFNDKGVEVTINGKIIILGKPLNNLVGVDFKIYKHKVNVMNSQLRAYNTINNNDQLWHQRLGHIGKTKFLELKNKEMVNDLNLIDKIMPNDNLCEACVK